ncbi:hypothetical protein JAAARDRAFT_201091 [Jaapia argillacea MUCL 33604]|uniref:Uncharacterized protein n=1 Tax=Jaapia argillacea MUCL 33604 TaxID=933084 RepID=A0A067PDQ5_9AGAM|nr:hypothetical protein JAAARDRAFT_201091 [Jaapia argillacea MUCL 33604]
MDSDEDSVANGEMEGDAFMPFASELDWRIAQWAIQESPGKGSVDRLLAIPGVKEKLGLSYKNVLGIHRLVNSIPKQAPWLQRSIILQDNPEEQHLIQYRDILKLIQSLFANPAHAKDMRYAPIRVYSDAENTQRIYHEMWTGRWWNIIQMHFLEEQL